MDILWTIEENALFVYISVWKLVESLHREKPSLLGSIQDEHKTMMPSVEALLCGGWTFTCQTFKPRLMIPNT